MSKSRWPGTFRRKGQKTWSYRAQFGDGDERWGVSGGGYETAKAAYEARNRAIEEARPLHGVTQRPDSSLTLARYLEAWVADHTRTLRSSTAATYRSRVNKLLLSPVTQKKIRQLTEADYRRLVSDLRDQSPSHTTLTLKVGTLVTALDAAVRNGVIPGHPLRSIKVSRSSERFEPRFWDLETARKFLAHRKAARDPLYLTWHLALATGMRRGELHGLRREDFDLERGLVHVRRQRVEVEGTVIETAPKTASSEAPVHLDAGTVALLREHVWTSDYLVNDPRTGRPYQSLRLFTVHWKRACENANVPHIRFHDLRHTSASLLADAGVPLVLAQQRLRHWSSRMTARYTHALDGAGGEVADRIGKLLSPDEAA